MNRKIETPHLTLVDCNRETLEAAIAGNTQLAAHLEADVPEGWTEFGSIALEYALKKLDEGKEEEGWWTYLPLHKKDQKLIGCCGFKGKPDERGIVEIGYEIAPDYRNRGLATELAGALVDHAFTFPEVMLVQAHTLGEVNASTHVLSKCGFQKTEVLSNAALGTLWKWELKKP